MKPYALFPRTPGLFSSLNVQKNMLQDRQRVAKFREAIFKTVRDGDVVVDLGTGTGILAIWAAQAGAKKVYAIEETDVSDVAEAVIRSNGFGDVITVLKANSSEVTLPEHADVLIAEVVGHFLFEEGIIEAISGAREALLGPRARLVPDSAVARIAPAELGAAFTEVSFWDSWRDPDLSVIRGQAANSAYVETVRGDQILAEPRPLFEVDFNTVCSHTMTARAGFRPHRPGRLEALVGWFDLSLCDGVRIDTSPWSERTHWQQCVFPLEDPVPVNPENVIEYSLSISPFMPGSKWKWDVTVSGPGGSKAEAHEFSITYGQDSRLLKERF